MNPPRNIASTLLLLPFLFCSVWANAQEARTFTITGFMLYDSLRYTPKKIDTLYLVHLIDGAEVPIATSAVQEGRFSFTGTAPEQIEAGFITGFDNGSIQLFLEAGHIEVEAFDARFPVSANVHGTPANNILHQFNLLNASAAQGAAERFKTAVEALPDSIASNPTAFQPYHHSIFNTNSAYHRALIMEFVAQNLTSPAALYIMNYGIYHLFQPSALEPTLLQAVPTTLQAHPLYYDMLNKARAANMAIGSLAPDISGQTPDGQTISLSHLRGKYVLLDFWASWCGPCRREFPFMKKAIALTEQYPGFIILGYSMDNDKDDWVKCIEHNQLSHPNWLHISTLKGWNSQAVKLYNVEAVPTTVLIDPQGHIVEFGLRGEAMLERVSQIIKGE